MSKFKLYNKYHRDTDGIGRHKGREELLIRER
jgi:hypothetical protein